MKQTAKILGSAGAFLLALSAAGQTLISENFNLYTMGNVGTNLDGTVPGQGGWLTYSDPGVFTGNDDFIIYQEAPENRAIRIEGIEYQAAQRQMWDSAFPSLWATRSPGNNVVKAECYYKGAVSMSTNQKQFYIKDAAGVKVLAGFTIWGNNNGILPQAYATDFWGNAANTYFYFDASNTPYVLPENTWVKLTLFYNKNSGDCRFVISNVDGTVIKDLTVDGQPNLTPSEIGFGVSESNFENHYQSYGYFDNFAVSALGTLDIDSYDNGSFSVFPDPASDFININSGSEAPFTAMIYAMDGRLIEDCGRVTNSTVNVSMLASGTYIISVDDGTTIKRSRFIKR